MKTEINMFLLSIKHFSSDIRCPRYLHLKKVYFLWVTRYIQQCFHLHCLWLGLEQYFSGQLDWLVVGDGDVGLYKARIMQTQPQFDYQNLPRKLGRSGVLMFGGQEGTHLFATLPQKFYGFWAQRTQCCQNCGPWQLYGWILTLQILAVLWMILGPAKLM